MMACLKVKAGYAERLFLQNYKWREFVRAKRSLKGFSQLEMTNYLTVCVCVQQCNGI